MCNHFDSVINNVNCRKKLASHKYQYHYKYKQDKNNIEVFLKTNESIEYSVNKYKEKVDAIRK